MTMEKEQLIEALNELVWGWKRNPDRTTYHDFDKFKIWLANWCVKYQLPYDKSFEAFFTSENESEMERLVRKADQSLVYGRFIGMIEFIKK